MLPPPPHVPTFLCSVNAFFRVNPLRRLENTSIQDMKKCRSVELARNAFVVFLAGVGWTLQTSQVSVMHQPCSCLIVLVATATTTTTYYYYYYYYYY